jgi:carbonic anhydrase
MTDSGDGPAKHEVTRREAWKLAGAAAGVVAVSRFWPSSAAKASALAPAQTTTPPWNHNPASPIGPSHWGTIGYPVCGSGTGQSPVNIDTRAVARLNGPPLLAKYDRSELAIENTGHVVEVPIPAGVTDTLRIGNDTYQLVQYHFHAPSEHEINGRLADVEAHFVHQNSQGDTAVVGIFFRRGGDPNPLLDKILFSAPVTANGEVTVGEANPAELFPVACRSSENNLNVGSFYTYGGSLTTPGCTEGVRWFVLGDGGHVSPAAVRRFHFVISRFPHYGGYPNNNRPVQPLNGRVISFRDRGS